MQIQLLLQNYLRSSTQYRTLLNELQRQRQQCIQKRSKDHPICHKNYNQFQEYFSAYLQQFKNKGQEICSQNLMELISKNKNFTYDQMKNSRRQCLEFYMKGSIVYQKNVIEKLKSIVERLQFNQL